MPKKHSKPAPKYIEPKHPPVDINDVRPREPRVITGSRTDMSIVLNVTLYSVRVYPGQYGLPPADGNYAGTDLGYIILEGNAESSPPNLPVVAFFVHFVPDGLTFPTGGYSAPEQAVEVVMNWSQFQPLLTLLQTADSVQAIYSSSGGTVWADVEGQFKRK